MKTTSGFFNLSDVTVKKDYIKTLKMGLRFTPQGKLNKFENCIDVS